MRHFLKTGFLLLGCLLVVPLQLTQGESEEGKQLVWEVWQIPASAVSTGKSATRTPKPGFVVREGSDKWDATEFVESLGGKKAPGSEAAYHPDQECLVVKNTRECISAIGSTISAAGLENAPAHIVSEFSIYECVLDPKPENGFVAWPTYADLIGGNAKGARIVDSISGTTKSGLRAKFLRHTPTGEKNASPNTEAAEKPALGSDEPGIEAELECVIFDPSHIDTVLSFGWRGHLQDRTIASLSFMTAFTGIKNQPLVIHVAARKNAPGKYLVVTAEHWQESAIDWTLESLSKIAEKVRELDAKAKSSSPPTCHSAP